jgi:hypothetical protein
MNINSKRLKQLKSGTRKGVNTAIDKIHIIDDLVEVTDGQIAVQERQRVPADKEYFIPIHDIVLPPCEELNIVKDEILWGNMKYSIPISEERFPNVNNLLKQAKKKKTIAELIIRKDILQRVLKTIPDGAAITFNVKEEGCRIVHFKTDYCEGVVLANNEDDQEKTKNE